MATTNTNPTELLLSQHERKCELESFDNMKTGVKGLLDAGIEKLPKIFMCNNNTNAASFESNQSYNKKTTPMIDLKAIHLEEARTKVVEEIGRACEEWGFFQVVNHGIPMSILDGMIDGVKRFHELDNEAKKIFYSREERRKFRFNSNFDLYKAPVANWRDSFECVLAPSQPHPHDLPEVCRDIILEYSKEMKKVGTTLLELFSEALGLKPDHLNELECGEGMLLLGHYYPACPEPHLAIGHTSHSDADFFTVLLQDAVGGLQILHQDNWIDVPPCPGSSCHQHW